jgi:hypothetical protein
MNNTTIDRTVNYFKLTPALSKGKTLSDFNSVFTDVLKLTKTKSKDRFVKAGDKLLYLNEIKFNPAKLSISGKLLNIRTDAWPEKMNMTDDIITEIAGTDKDGIIESSHFILSYAKSSLILALEFNQFGPRISDFTYYLQGFLKSSAVATGVDFLPYYRDDLPNYKRRINRISFMVAKVHKDEIKRINEVDSELFDAFETASKISEAEYVTLQLKFDTKTNSSLKFKDKILKIIGMFQEKKETQNSFKTLKVKAEDEDRRNKIKEFDLLNIWVKSEIKVSKRPTSKVIISSEMFELMGIELSKEFKGR